MPIVYASTYLSELCLMGRIQCIGTIPSGRTHAPMNVYRWAGDEECPDPLPLSVKLMGPHCAVIYRVCHGCGDRFVGRSTQIKFYRFFCRFCRQARVHEYIEDAKPRVRAPRQKPVVPEPVIVRHQTVNTHVPGSVAYSLLGSAPRVFSGGTGNQAGYSRSHSITKTQQNGGWSA
jgi:hypothetical protein